MIIQLQPSISVSDQEAIVNKARALDYKTNEVKTQLGSYIIAIGKKEFDIRTLGHLPGITDIHRVSEEYTLDPVSNPWRNSRSQAKRYC